MAPGSPPGSAPSNQRIVGYCGFIPGQQHLHGETYGRSASSPLRERAAANSHGEYLFKGDVRPASKNEVTLIGPGSPQAKAQYISQGGSPVRPTRHLPGYAGHIPGLDAGLSKTFGAGTTGPLQSEAEGVSAYAGPKGHLAKTMLPRELGPPHGQSFSRAEPVKPAAEPKVPGYKGFVPGRQHVYANTFGTTTSKIFAAHETNKADKNMFLSHIDSRPSAKADITTAVDTNHIPGYAGHIPGVDAGRGNTFGDSTTGQMINLAASITTGALESPTSIAISSIPRDKGAPRPQSKGPPPKAPLPGTDLFATEKRVPGYTGFQAGSQHVFGDTFGHMTGTLRTEHQMSPDHKNKFLNYAEDRGGRKSLISMEGSSRNTITDQNTKSHLPGYAGHCPAQREAIGARFGVSTSEPLYDKASGDRWYVGEAHGIPKKSVPRPRGLPRDNGGSVHVDVDKTRLPGYTGFIQHSKDTFAKTYGATTRQLNHPPPQMSMTTDIGRPYGDWALAGNNPDSNHLPGYAGHVPGYRDRPVGSTFGDSTRPGIFNAEDTVYKLNSQRIPASMYHSGLRMSEAKKKVVRSAVQLGTNQWNHELTTTGQVFSRGLQMP